MCGFRVRNAAGTAAIACRTASRDSASRAKTTSRLSAKCLKNVRTVTPARSAISAVVAELINSGHHVTGLARSDRSAAILEKLGATPVFGSIDDLVTLTAAARESDGAIHMAHMSGPSHAIDELISSDVNAITALGEGLKGSGKPGVVSVEIDAPSPDAMAYSRVSGENACFAFTEHDVRTVIMRLAPTVHGPNEHGFIPLYLEAARRTGIAAYVGDGENRWSAAHRQDAASLYRLAIEKAPTATILHAVAETEILFKTIAELVGKKLGLPVESISSESAPDHFGSAFMAAAYAADSPASSVLTQNLLNWRPNHGRLAEDLEHGDYLI